MNKAGIKAMGAAGRNTRNAFLKRLPLTTALGGLAMMSYGRSAYAGDCAGTGGTYLCTGAADPATDGEILITRDGPLEVTTEDGFGVDRSQVGGASAILLRSRQGASFVTGNDVTILANDGASGFDFGVALDIFNIGGGDVVVDTIGAEVSGAFGILIDNFGFGGHAGSAGLFVTSGNVSSTTGGPAIFAIQSKSADLGTDIVIDTTGGAISSTGSEGIFAFGAGSATNGTANIAISTGNVSSSDVGIKAERASGSGGANGASITIDARAGAVNSLAGTGIEVRHEGASTAGAADATIIGGNISGSSYGIDLLSGANGFASAQVMIDTVAGNVSGAGGAGIAATHIGYSLIGDVNMGITTGNVSGGSSGVRAFMQGDGGGRADLTIDTTAGAVTSASGVGIDATQNGYSYGNTAGLAITAGEVIGSTDGVRASGVSDALESADVMIDTRAGSVTGSDGVGITATQNGLSRNGTANLIITAANVTGSMKGIDARNDAQGAAGAGITIDTTAGAVSSQSKLALYALNEANSAAGAVDISIVTGDVSAAGTAPAAPGDPVRDSTGAITVNLGGTGATGANLTLDTTLGNIASAVDVGIQIEHQGTAVDGRADIALRSGNVSGDTAGIALRHSGYGSAGADVTIDTSAGLVRGGRFFAILANQDAQSQDGTANMEITTADVISNDAGIEAVLRASALGNTDLIINTVAGAVETGFTGIFARQYGQSAQGSSNIRITTSNVLTFSNAVSARGDGRSYGDTNIIIDTSAGAISSGRSGIETYMTSSSVAGTADMLITAADTSGIIYGIRGAHRGDAYGNANLVIDSTGGMVSALRGFGVVADHYGVSGSGSADVIVTTADVTGSLTGISSNNGGLAYGSNNLVIDTSAGSVVGDRRLGIEAKQTARSNYGSANLRITTADVSGYTSAIYARHEGHAFANSNLIIDTVAGAVFGATEAGIAAVQASYSGDASTDLRITTANVTGGETGIYAFNEGSASNNSDLIIDTRAGAVLGLSSYGIEARQRGQTYAGSADLVITTGNVTGGYIGIYGINTGSAYGDSKLSIDASAGSVIGETTFGIEARHYGRSEIGSAELSITAADVTGGTIGIFARNRAYADGVNDIAINTVAGSVVGENGSGIVARHDGVSSSSDTDILIRTANVSGTLNGIYARNGGDAYGYSDIVINTVAGSVSGAAAYGIYASNGGSALDGSADVRITTADVSGGMSGIIAINDGDAYYDSEVRIDTSAGSVIGGADNGIAAVQNGYAETGASDLIITTADVTGGNTGIYASSRGYASGASNLIIDSSAGSVVGQNARGIDARHDGYSEAGTADLIITTADIAGATTAIHATNTSAAYAGSALTIDSSAGSVSGATQAGIYAAQAGQSFSGSADLTITTADVTGRTVGIHAIIAAEATSDTTLAIDTRAGRVLAQEGVGILAENFGTTGTTAITIGDTAGATTGIFVDNAASGGLFLTATPDGEGVIGLQVAGIAARNTGSGATQIVVDAVAPDARVAGAQQGILAMHASQDSFTIDVRSGTVANTDGLSTSRAITARSDQRGVALTIGPDGAVIGTLDLTAHDDVVTNAGRWDATGGISDFGGGSNVLNNTSSNTLVVGNGQPNQTTQFLNLQTFNNSGRIAMNDGDASGRLLISGDFNGSGNSLIEMNIDAAAGMADMVAIGGDVTGSTTIRLVGIGPEEGGLTGFGQNDGLGLIAVAGNTSSGNFALAQPLQQDVFLFNDLVLGNDNMWRVQSQYLPSIPAYDAYPTLLLNLGALSAPIRQQAAANRQQAGALWFEGARSTTRQGEKYSRIDTSYRQHATGLTLGLDYSISSSVLTTLTVHYMDSTGHVASPHGDARIHTDGYGLGGRVMWTGADGAFVGAQGRLMLFNSALPGVDDNDANAKAFSIEAGKMFAMGSGWNLTPYAMLNYANVDFDIFTGGFGETVARTDGETVQGRLGLLVDRLWGDRSSTYLGLSLDHALSDSREVEVRVNNAHRFGRDDGVTALSASAGGRIAVAANSFLTGDVAASRAFGATEDILAARANLGLRVAW